ncbi:hypothetical protein MC378_02500 [Polaribacter sp. MSW13]|uniref:Uncharacterized protein n=1 Tax=Polaribacter marinus TaxID=2916838 RepID=A0A9X1VM42_9FLAO|nr:hypothetical protein [Polaribacter marinus]MCI2228022.1 hypothetical protein [Polaribacter marinus]
MYSQKSLNISLHQDFKLFAFGDKLGNNAGTLDLISRVKYESKQQKIGYFVYGVEFEKANINNHFYRYGGLVGYSFNKILNNTKLYLSPTIGYGAIKRNNVNCPSWSSSLQAAYKLSKIIKISSLFQFTERTDLYELHGLREIRYSFFVGVEINLFKFN